MSILPATAVQLVGILPAAFCFLSLARGALRDSDRSAPPAAPSMQATAPLAMRGVKRPSSACVANVKGSSKVRKARQSSDIDIVADIIEAGNRAGLSANDYLYQCCLGMARILANSESPCALTHYVSLFKERYTQQPAPTDALLMPVATVLLLVHDKGDVLVDQLGRQAFTALNPHYVRQFIMLAIRHKRAALIVTWLPCILADTAIDATEVYSSVAAGIQTTSEAVCIVLAIWTAAGQQAQLTSSDADTAHYHLVQLTARIKSARLSRLQYHSAIKRSSKHKSAATATESWHNTIRKEIERLYASLTRPSSVPSPEIVLPFHLLPIQVTSIYILQLIPLEQLPAAADYMLRRKYAPLAAQASRPVMYKLLTITGLIVCRWLERSASHPTVFSKLLQLFKHQAHVDLLYFIIRHNDKIRKIDTAWQQASSGRYKISYNDDFSTKVTWHDVNAALLQCIAAQLIKTPASPGFLWIYDAQCVSMLLQRSIEGSTGVTHDDAPAAVSPDTLPTAKDLLHERTAAIWFIELQYLHALYIATADFAARLKHPVLSPVAAHSKNTHGYDLSLITRLLTLANILQTPQRCEHIRTYLAARPLVWKMLPCVWYAINSMQAFCSPPAGLCSRTAPFCQVLHSARPEGHRRVEALKGLCCTIISIPEIVADMHGANDPRAAVDGHAELVSLLQSRPDPMLFMFYLYFFLQWPCPLRLNPNIDWSRFYRNITRALAYLADSRPSACNPRTAVHKWLSIRLAHYSTENLEDPIFDAWIPSLRKLPYLSFRMFLALPPVKAAQTGMIYTQKTDSERASAANLSDGKSSAELAFLEAPVQLLTDYLASSLPVLSPALHPDSLAELYESSSTEISQRLTDSPDLPKDFSVFEFPNLSALNYASGSIYD